MAESVWNSSDTLKDSNSTIATKLKELSEYLKATSQANQVFMELVKASYEVQKALAFDVINILFKQIENQIKEFDEQLAAYESLGFYYLTVDPFSIPPDSSVNVKGNYVNNGVHLAPAYRNDEGDLLPLYEDEETGQLKDIDGNAQTQETVAGIGLTVPVPKLTKAPTTTGKPKVDASIGSVQFSPGDVLKLMGEAFDDQGDLNRPTFPDSITTGAIVVLVCSTVPRTDDAKKAYSNALNALSTVLDVDGIKDIAEELKNTVLDTYTSQDVIVSEMCSISSDQGEIINALGGFKKDDIVIQVDPTTGEPDETPIVGTISEMIVQPQQYPILKPIDRPTYDLNYVNIFANEIANIVPGTPQSVTESVLGSVFSGVDSAGNITTDGDRTRDVNVEPESPPYQTATYRIKPLVSGQEFESGKSLQLAKFVEDKQTNAVIEESDGTLKQAKASNIHDFDNSGHKDPKTGEEVKDETKMHESTPTNYTTHKVTIQGGGSTIVSTIVDKMPATQQAKPPVFENLLMGDIIPGWTATFQRLRKEVFKLQRLVRSSKGFLDDMIKELEEKIEAIISFTQAFDDFIKVLESLVSGLLNSGIYTYYIPPKAGGVKYIQQEIENASTIAGSPTSINGLNYSIGFLLVGGGPDPVDIPGGITIDVNPASSVKILGQILGIDKSTADPTVDTESTDESSGAQSNLSNEEELKLRGTKSPTEGGIILESNARLYYDLTSQAPEGWRYDPLVDNFFRTDVEQTRSDKLDILDSYVDILEDKEVELETLKEKVSLIEDQTNTSETEISDLPQTKELKDRLIESINILENDITELQSLITLNRGVIVSASSNAVSTSDTTVVLTQPGSWLDFNVTPGDLLVIDDESREIATVVNSSFIVVKTAFSQTYTDVESVELEEADQTGWKFTVKPSDISNTISSKYKTLSEIIGISTAVDTNEASVSSRIGESFPNFPTLPDPYTIDTQLPMIVLNARKEGFGTPQNPREYNWVNLGIQIGDEITVDSERVKVVYIPHQHYNPISWEEYDEDGEVVPKQSKPLDSFDGDQTRLDSSREALGDENTVVVIPWPPTNVTNNITQKVKPGSTEEDVFTADIDDTTGQQIANFNSDLTFILPRTKAFTNDVTVEENYVITPLSEILNNQQIQKAQKIQDGIDKIDQEKLKELQALLDEFNLINNRVTLIDGNVTSMKLSSVE